MTALYVLAAVGCHAAVALWFIVSMVVTGHRYRRVAERFAADRVEDPARLSYEELGLLAGGERRCAEVALFRLCLSGHVRVEERLVLVNDPDDGSPAERSMWETGESHGESPTCRDVMLRKLRRHGRPVYLVNLLTAGERRGDSTDARRRLLSLGLIDEDAERLASARDRVNRRFPTVFALAVIAAIASLALAVGDPDPARIPLWYVGVAIGLFLVTRWSTKLAYTLTGGRLTWATATGVALLSRAKREVPDSSDKRRLRHVALVGLLTIPEFEQAARAGTPDFDGGPKGKTLGVVANLVSTVGTIVGGGGGKR